MNKFLFLLLGIGGIVFFSKGNSTPILGTDAIYDNGNIVHFQTPIAP